MLFVNVDWHKLVLSWLFWIDSVCIWIEFLKIDWIKCGKSIRKIGEAFLVFLFIFIFIF